VNRRIWIYLTGVLAAFGLTLAMIALLMNPPAGDLISLGTLLGGTGLVSAMVGYLSHRLGWWRRFRSLAAALTLSYLLAAGLTLLNVWVTARLMFLNLHDFYLATLLLVFASLISVSFGYFISATITQALREVLDAAEMLSRGDYSTRIPERGRDEVAMLARTFNQMVTRLEAAAIAERGLEETRRNLVAWASHDLRTPLASLRAMIDALAEDVVEDPQTVKRYLKQSQGEINRISRLIDDLFELAQIDAGRLEIRGEPASLTDLISDTLEGFGVRAQMAGLELTGRAGSGIDPVWMAPESIGRVIANLVENAIRYTGPGGHVWIGAELENGFVHVQIKDDGAGIPQTDLPHIFDRFYRGEASRTRQGYQDGARGAGLGLSIAQGIVAAHGGTIWAESKPGAGAVLHFTLPKNGSAGSQG